MGVILSHCGISDQVVPFRVGVFVRLFTFESECAGFAGGVLDFRLVVELGCRACFAFLFV